MARFRRIRALREHLRAARCKPQLDRYTETLDAVDEHAEIIALKRPEVFPENSILMAPHTGEQLFVAGYHDDPYSVFVKRGIGKNPPLPLRKNAPLVSIGVADYETAMRLHER